MPIVEFFWFSASDSFKADHDSLIKPVLDHISKVEGCKSAYYGFSEESEEKFYLVIVWESYEHYQALKDQSSCQSMANKIKPYIVSAVHSKYYVEFRGDTSAVFKSPITEIFMGKAKEGKSEEEFKAVMTAMGDLINGADRPTAVGQTREEPDRVFALIGWESSKAYYDLVSGEKFAQARQNLKEVVDIQVVLVKLIEYA